MTIDITKTIHIPRNIADCPECHAALICDVFEWDSETKIPTRGGVHIGCKFELGDGSAIPVMRWHRHWQSDWQDVNDKVYDWIVKELTDV